MVLLTFVHNNLYTRKSKPTHYTAITHLDFQVLFEANMHYTKLYKFGIFNIYKSSGKTKGNKYIVWLVAHTMYQHSIVPLDDSFLVFIILAAYSTLDALWIHLLTTLKAPL